MAAARSGCVLIVLGVSAFGQTVQSPDYLRAETLLRNHEWDQGIELVRQLLQVTPNAPKLLNLAGLAYTGKGDRAQADVYFRSALKADPAFVASLKNLGVNELSLGEIAAAREHLESASRLSPDDQVVNLYLGEILYRQGEYKAAAGHLRRATSFLGRDPNLAATLAISELESGDRDSSLRLLGGAPAPALNPETALRLGVALAKAELPTEAVPYLGAARNSYPQATDLNFDLALCYMSLKRYPDAITVLEQVSTTGRETSDIDNLLAEAYEANHQTQHAVNTLRRSIALNPQDDDSYLEFASICIDHQDFGNAEKVLGVALGVHPKSSQLLFERGILDAMQDHFEAAEKDFQDAANIAPADNSAYIGLGVAFLETGNTARAIPLLRTRLSEHPNEANISYLLGEALMRTSAQTGDPAFVEAGGLFERAVRLDPKLVEPHISLGSLYLRQGRFNDAVVELERARSLDPQANSAYSHLAIAYRRLGQADKSKQVLLELKDVVDRERTGSRPPVASGQPAPEKPKSAQN